MVVSPGRDAPAKNRNANEGGEEGKRSRHYRDRGNMKSRDDYRNDDFAEYDDRRLWANSQFPGYRTHRPWRGLPFYDPRAFFSARTPDEDERVRQQRRRDKYNKYREGDKERVGTGMTTSTMNGTEGSTKGEHTGAHKGRKNRRGRHGSKSREGELKSDKELAEQEAKIREKLALEEQRIKEESKLAALKIERMKEEARIKHEAAKLETLKEQAKIQQEQAAKAEVEALRNAEEAIAEAHRQQRRIEKEERRKQWEEWRDGMLNRSLKDFDKMKQAMHEDEASSQQKTETDYSIPLGHLSREHPSRTLPPIDILFLMDTSSSIGIGNFEKVRTSICTILEDIDVAPGRSRVSVVQFAAEPSVVFGFDKYCTITSVQKAIQRIVYTGGATNLAKALNFVAGVMWKEQNMADGKHRKHKLAVTPRHDRLQVICVASDGSNDEKLARSTTMLHEKLQVRVCALITRSLHRDKLVEVTRFEGAIFVVDQTEAFNIWLWRQQRVWVDNYSRYLERERSMPLDSKRSPKKTGRNDAP